MGRPGSYNHYDIDADTFVNEWNVDYIKFDTCHLTLNQRYNPRPYYTQMSNALIKAAASSSNNNINNRSSSILYSMCNWGKHKPWEWAPKIANSWRTSWDIYPSYYRMMQILDITAPLYMYAGLGARNDPDMLEIGIPNGTFFNWKKRGVRSLLHSNLTQRESLTQLSLWSMLGAPLIIGLDLTSAPSWVIRALSNKELIQDINQDSMGLQAERIVTIKKGFWIGPLPVCVSSSSSSEQQHSSSYSSPSFCVHTEVWRKPLSNGRMAVSLFNRADSFNQYSSQFNTNGELIHINFTTLFNDGINQDNKNHSNGSLHHPPYYYSVRDVLARTDNGTAVDSISANVLPHGIVVLILKPSLIRGTNTTMPSLSSIRRRRQ